MLKNYLRGKPSNKNEKFAGNFHGNHLLYIDGLCTCQGSSIHLLSAFLILTRVHDDNNETKHGNVLKLWCTRLCVCVCGTGTCAFKHSCHAI